MISTVQFGAAAGRQWKPIKNPAYYFPRFSCGGYFRASPPAIDTIHEPQRAFSI
jgi:hypothetical protein